MSGLFRWQLETPKSACFWTCRSKRGVSRGVLHPWWGVSKNNMERMARFDPPYISYEAGNIATLNGADLIREAGGGIVAVEIQYRLGIFGTYHISCH